MERDYSFDDTLLETVRSFLQSDSQRSIVVSPQEALNNRNKSVGAQLSLDVERILNYELVKTCQNVLVDHRGRRYLDHESIQIHTEGSAGQSFAAFCNDGFVFRHTGTCNDGVGKSASGGKIIIKSPQGGGKKYGENVLVGNFTLLAPQVAKLLLKGRQEIDLRFAIPALVLL